MKLSSKENPKLQYSIENNERIFLFLRTQLYGPTVKPFAHELQQVESYTAVGPSSKCMDRQHMAEMMLNNPDSKNYIFQIQVDWVPMYQYGVCIEYMADLCNGDEMNNIKYINYQIMMNLHRPINLVMMDYVGHRHGDVDHHDDTLLINIVQHINECTVGFVNKGEVCEFNWDNCDCEYSKAGGCK